MTGVEMNRLWIALAALGAAFSLSTKHAEAHCQVPCGIYDDHARIHAMREDITTISKAVGEVRALTGKGDAQSINQLVRWTNTKEAHAEKIIRTISDYFLTQKIKPVSKTDKAGYAAYLEMLAHHHAVMKAAMLCKQTVSPKAVEKLQTAVNAIEKYWPPNAKK